MKTCFAFLYLLAALLADARAQGVGIGTATPDASAALDVAATTRGLLVPRLTAAQRAGIAAPATGLLVYQTDGAAPGFYYNAGPPAAPAWTFLNPVGGADNLGNHTATQPLNLGGQPLTGTGASLGAAVGVGVRADGGLNLGQNIPGNNVYLGYQAGQANTASVGNLFVGYQAGRANTTGSSNVFSGYLAGYLNTAGTNNVFIGNISGIANTTGSANLFSGSESGGSNTTGSFNQFSGFRAGYFNTTGEHNLFNGYASGAANTTGSRNQFSGYQSGQANTTANENQFGGYQSGSSNTTGSRNQFTGYQSGQANTTGSFNLFSGYRAGQANTTGSENQFVGFTSGLSNTTGSFNQFSGYQSGVFNTTGSRNHFDGRRAGFNNTTGSENDFRGYESGQANTIGSANQFGGYQSGFSNTTGGYNLFSGYQSGKNNTTGSENQFDGISSGYSNTTGSTNLFVGGASGYSNTSGNYNLFGGYLSGYYNTTGSDNTALGYDSGPRGGGLTNTTAIGSYAAVRQSNSLVLGGPAASSYAVQVGIGTGAPAARLHVYSVDNPAVIRIQSSGAFGSAGLDLWSDPQGAASEWRPAFLRSTDAGSFTGGLAFYTNGSGTASLTGAVEGMRLVNGRLGIGTATPGFTLDVNGAIRCVGAVNTTSDARLKQHIRPLAGALAGVLALRGVRYTFRQAEFAALKLPAGEQVGLLAQEVARVYPELVSADPQGLLSVNYAQLAPVLIEAMREQQAQIEALKGRAATAEAKAAALETAATQAAADHADLQTLKQQLARLLGEAAPAGTQARR